jgi:hypothetical protein
MQVVAVQRLGRGVEKRYSGTPLAVAVWRSRLGTKRGLLLGQSFTKN